MLKTTNQARSLGVIMDKISNSELKNNLSIFTYFFVRFRPFSTHNYSDSVLASERCQNVGDQHSILRLFLQKSQWTRLLKRLKTASGSLRFPID